MDAESEIVRDTMRFTLRQATWFKTFTDATWVNTSELPGVTVEQLAAGL